MTDELRARWAAIPLRSRGFTFAFLALLIWSFWPVWTRQGVTQGLAPADIVFLRFSVGGMIFLPFLLRQAKSIPRRGWLVGLGLALCQGAPFVLLMAMGLRHAPANHAASLATGTSPLFAALLAAAWFAEPITKGRWLGLLLVLGGAGTLAIASAGGQSAAGHALFLAASAMAAIYMVAVSRSGLTAFQAAAIVSVISMIFFVPAYFALGLGHLEEAPVVDIVLQGAYQGILVAVVSFVLFNAAIARLGAAPVSALCALLPVLTLLLAIPVLGEWPSQIETISVLLISAGVCLAALANRVRASATVTGPASAGAE